MFSLLQAAGTMSMYCPLRREIMESALDRGKEETAVTMKVGEEYYTQGELEGRIN